MAKWFLCYHLLCSLEIFVNVSTFLYVKVNSKVICEELSISSFFLKKCWCQQFLWFTSYYLVKKMRGYPHFPLWIPIAQALQRSTFSAYLVGTVLNFSRGFVRNHWFKSRVVCVLRKTRIYIAQVQVFPKLSDRSCNSAIVMTTNTKARHALCGISR